MPGLMCTALGPEINHFSRAFARNSLYRHHVIRRYFSLHKNHNCSSKAAVSTKGYETQTRDLTLTTNNGGDKRASRVKVILMQKSLVLKSLMSHEGPVVHDALSGAVVDVRADEVVGKDELTPRKKEVEVKLRVEQLLTDAKLSIKNAPDLQPYEDVEYVEDPENKKKVKPELVGALSPNALDWRLQRIDLSKLGSYYASLSKSRLTGLVVLTAMAGYAMAPSPLDPITLLYCSVGTGLTSSAANTINQFFEVPYDSQMDRTKNRILVRGLVTPLHAVCYGMTCGLLGVSLLYFGVNEFAAALGALNLFLYTSVYTPLKRMSIVNTWVGSVVGAIPPLIGWVGCSGELEVGAWIMAAILYGWQFPHFNALSWNLRADYSRAGYRMMSVTNPGMCRRVALRHSVGMIAICTAAPMLNVTTWTFAIDSLPFNGYLAYLAWRFYQDGDSKSSRKLFMFSLIHLPAIMMLMIISKKNYSKKNEVENVEKDSDVVIHIPEGTVR
ncbi:protoheme IX farnesyltransferase, mitochondrial [Macrobrachium rosenbergii]|uniref:protoheme IX farnesyltransferase, mitochondrial n=1 Tax=Macrobrachium rosenbergii TaxID=79674 RepID=UPI0034D550A1